MPGSNMRTVCRADHECGILIVDDNKTVLDMLTMTLEPQKNLRLLTAGSLREALELIRITPQLELVLLDLWLENNDPIGCLQQVVKARNGRVAVIGMSGDYELENAAFDNGAIDFWRKPLEIDVIGRAKLAIMNQRNKNLSDDRGEELLKQNAELLERNAELVEELEIIRGNIKTDPESAIEELDLTTQELKQEGQVLKQEIQTLMMRAN